jgi:NADPH-ferrihemoprotein reductase
MSKIVESSLLASILQNTQEDDVAFLALIIFSGIFYTLFIKEKPDPFHYVWFEKPQSMDGNAKSADTRDIGVKLDESVRVYPETENKS